MGRLIAPTAEYVVVCVAQLSSTDIVIPTLQGTVCRDTDSEDSGDEDQDPIAAEYRHHDRRRLILQVNLLIRLLC